MKFLSSKKIHTSIHFKPLHLHSLFKQPRKYVIADYEWKRLITLPCHSAMNDDDINYVIYWVKKYFSN